jgi:D-alanyl-D-alanine carboxypeptidase (penicillin-binding protein 5/6)
MPTRKAAYAAAAIVAIALALVAAGPGTSIAATKPAKQPPAAAAAPAQPAVPVDPNAIETPAREAFLIDYDTGVVLLNKNGDERMPPSSMSKLMTAYLVFDRLKKGSLKLEDEFPVSERAWRAGGAASGGSTMFLPLGARVKVEDLLHGIIIQSGNDACIVVAEGLASSEEAFAEMMNAKAKELGLDSSTFRNASGLPDPDHMMTARDLATLARRIINDFPEYYKIYSQTSFTYNGITQGNRNPLLYKGIGADGLKTGHTEAAGYGLTASVKRGDRRLILVVNGLRSMNERSQETERLIDWGFREFENYKLVKAGQPVGDAPVWLGAQERVPLVADKDVVVTMRRTAKPNMTVKLVYDSPIPAPIRKGDKVAQIEVSAPDSPSMTIPVVAGADVEPLGRFGRITAALHHYISGGSGQP